MKFATAANSGSTGHPGPARGGGQLRRRPAAFTLAEVLAALMFLAIVIPVAVEALHIASASGVIAVRKAEAARVADRVLNEALVLTNWTQALAGTVTRNGQDYRWSIRNDNWTPDPAITLLTATVEFSAQGRPYSVQLATLENPLVTTGATNSPQ
jgi:type II secretory pathway pseudopilin PulG